MAHIGKAKAALVAAGLIACAGCMSSNQHVRTGASRAALVSADGVAVYSTAPEGSVEVGLVIGEANGRDQRSMDLAVRELRKGAATIGANGIVILSAGTRHAPDTLGPDVGFVLSNGLLISSGDWGMDKTVLQGRAIYVPERP